MRVPEEEGRERGPEEISVVITLIIMTDTSPINVKH